MIINFKYMFPQKRVRHNTNYIYMECIFKDKLFFNKKYLQIVCMFVEWSCEINEYIHKLLLNN